MKSRFSAHGLTLARFIMVCGALTADGLSSPGVWAAVEKSLLKSQEGVAALLQGRFDQAILAYDEALRESNISTTRQASIYSDRGVAKWRLKQFDGAMADLTKAVSLNADSATVFNNRGIVLMDLGRVDEAYKDFDRSVALSSNFGPALCNRGNALQALGRPDDADKDFRKAIDVLPANAVPFNGRGKIATALGKNYAALRYFNRALAINAQYGTVYQNRAVALLGLGKNDDAVLDLDKVIALNPDNAGLYAQRGQAHAREKRGLQASRDFQKALELNPKNADALIGRAGQNIERKRPDLAQDDLNQAIALDPGNASAYFWRGQSRSTLNDAANATSDLDKAIELRSNYADAYRLRGSLREKAGQRELAISDYRRALELDPLAKEVRDAYKAATGETVESIVKPLGMAVAGWEVYKVDNRFVAYNERYPKIPVQLEMQGEGVPELEEWTALKDGLAGISLMRYKSGQVKSANFEHVAILDLYKNQVIAIEPFVWGDQRATWAWTPTAVTITDPEGLASVYDLRKAKPIEVANQPRRNRDDDPFSFLRDGRSDRRSRERGPGIFKWLFQ